MGSRPTGYVRFVVSLGFGLTGAGGMGGFGRGEVLEKAVAVGNCDSMLGALTRLSSKGFGMTPEAVRSIKLGPSILGTFGRGPESASASIPSSVAVRFLVSEPDIGRLLFCSSAK